MYQFEAKFEDACTLGVVVKSEGKTGGKEGVTVLQLTGLRSLAMQVETQVAFTDAARPYHTEEVTLTLQGDAELRVLIKALKFAVKKLEAVYEVTR